MDSVTQIINGDSPDLLLDALFILIGALSLAIVGLCVGLVANGAADPLWQRLSLLIRGWRGQEGDRRSGAPSARGSAWRNLTRR